MEEGDAYGVESVSLYQGYRRRLVSLSEQTPSAWRSRRTREEARFGASTRVRSQSSLFGQTDQTSPVTLIQGHALNAIGIALLHRRP